MKIHLIDYLAYCSHCNVSDLSSLPQYKLFYEVQKVPAENCTLEEWMDCIVYFSHDKNTFETVQEAKDFLLNWLSLQQSC